MTKQVRVVGSSLNQQVVDGHDETAPNAPSVAVTYTCHDKHTTLLRFAVDAPVPDLWECRTCSQFASHPGSASTDLPEGEFVPEGRKVHVPRTHYEQVLARRTRAELEALLEERLSLLRARRSGVRVVA